MCCFTCQIMWTEFHCSWSFVLSSNLRYSSKDIILRQFLGVPNNFCLFWFLATNDTALFFFVGEYVSKTTPRKAVEPCSYPGLKLPDDKWICRSFICLARRSNYILLSTNAEFYLNHIKNYWILLYDKQLLCDEINLFPLIIWCGLSIHCCCLVF